MLSTRIVIGSILAALAGAMLFADRWFAPHYPFLLATVVLLAGLGTHELLRLLPDRLRPLSVLAHLGVLVLILSHWLPQCVGVKHQINGAEEYFARMTHLFAAMVLLAFLAEMARYREPGDSVARTAATIWLFAYLGLLPGFLIRLRWLPSPSDGVDAGAVALALAVFVPKVCDIGAYFTGRLIGRHKMTPQLSPGKTWEGAAGGLAAAVGVSFALQAITPIIPGGPAGVAAFGLTVGAAGILGDLAESLIKRDCQRKDASAMVPGFGGVLDVIDSIVFAAPVVYWWLR
jgi:phosphatidate cytidylyltransferase